jgi:acetyl-CoA carboxylase carboxyl transferase subunit alpha
LIDRIVPEPIGGAHTNHKEAAILLKKVIIEELSFLVKIKPEKLVENRFEKFGRMGQFVE